MLFRSQGWKLANLFWEKRSQELIAIDIGEKPSEDSIANIYQNFLTYKIKIQKITDKSIEFYNYGMNSIFSDKTQILNEKNIKTQLENFIQTTKISPTSVNICLRAVSVF